jgi:glucans biosynthesis protein C
MLGSSQVGPVRPYDSSSIEQIRILATILLVAYHVIGLPTSGLRLDYPHPLRTFADLLGDFRMPAFAFVAGFVYALKPVRLGEFGSFVQRKLKRLAVPGVIAILVFCAVSAALGLHWAVAPESLWQLLVFPYAHFWFLQALLTILVVVGAIDAATRGKAEVPLLGIAIVLSLVSLPWPSLLSINQAVGLAPFFLAGIFYWRRRGGIARHARGVTMAAVASIALWCALTLAAYHAENAIHIGDRQIYALLFGVPMCTLLLFHPLPLPATRALGGYTFTIYLYHVLATAGMRRLLFELGVESIAVHVVLGVAAGLLLPAALHRLLLGWPLGAQLVLGIRRGKGPAPLQGSARPRPIAGSAPAEARR